MMDPIRAQLVDDIKARWPEAADRHGITVPAVRPNGTTAALINLAADVAMIEINKRDAKIETQRRLLDGKRAHQAQQRGEIVRLERQLARRRRWWTRQH